MNTSRSLFELVVALGVRREAAGAWINSNPHLIEVTGELEEAKVPSAVHSPNFH